MAIHALARIMGTSVRMIERHYGALLDGAAGDIAARLDAFEAERDLADEAEAESGWGVRATTGPRQKTGRRREWLGYGKRLMGFEPTTFCMASRRSSQLSYSRASAGL